MPPKSQDKKMSWFWEMDFEIFKKNPFKCSLHGDMQKSVSTLKEEGEFTSFTKKNILNTKA